jgi:hypothetical protein
VVIYKTPSDLAGSSNARELPQRQRRLPPFEQQKKADPEFHPK